MFIFIQMFKNKHIEIVTIYGKAGCGKTTSLSKIICNDTSEYIVLAPTNSAVETIYKTCIENANKQLEREHFKTIYSFFRIDYINDVVLGAIEMVETVYIDEFSLIDKFLFKRCLNDMISKGCKKLILCGDVMQLNAIYKTKQFISFNKMNKWNDIYQKILTEATNVNEKLIYPKVLEHLHLNVFGMKIIQQGTLINLTVNKRSNENIKNILMNIYNKNKDYQYNFIPFFDIPNYIINSNYVFIASKYSILQKVYDYIYENFWSKSKIQNDIINIEQHISFSSGFKNLYLYSGMKIIACSTDENKRYINGEELIFTGNFECGKMKCFNEKKKEHVFIEKVKEVEKTNGNLYYPICPSFLMTIHKSQGKTINNIIVCIDDMFDISMMYTAITRAKDNLVFFSKVNDNIERRNLLIKNAYVEEFKQLNLICNNVSLFKNKQKHK